MAYDPDTGWSVWSRQAEMGAREVIDKLTRHIEVYNEWQTFREGRSDSDIASAMGRTETEVADLDSCFAAFKEIYDFADNVASPTQGDRLYSMRRFS
jgi:hypothetical protein